MSGRLWIVIALVLGSPGVAGAFSDPALFAESATTGGGGGRYFTGSRADGYACSVCHQGGDAPQFVIDPLPETLVPGSSYELVVRWDDPDSPQALHLELATPSGAHPQVTTPPVAMLPAESRCAGLPGGEPAVYTFDVGARRVVGVADCGASRVAVTFVATEEPIELSISGVRSDGSSTADGDGVFDRRITLGRRLTSSGGGCSSGRGTATVVAPALLALLLRRRRRSRKLDAQERRGLQGPDVLEPDEREVIHARQGGAEAPDDDAVAILVLDPVDVLRTELVLEER